MATAFGKFCRMLRIKHDEVLRDMALKLGVSSSYLSAVENGKRPTPPSWRNVLIQLYLLTNQESIELDDAINQSQQKVEFNLNIFSDKDRDILLAFARQCDSADDDTKISLKNLFIDGETLDE